MLQIKDLHATAAGKEILRGIDLEIKAGEVHAIMGPNGSGKSTLAQVIAGRDTYEVTAGSVLFKGKDLLALSPEMRAVEGIFLGFQYPVEIPGLNTLYFLRAAVNAVRVHRGLDELDAMDFMNLAKEKMKNVAMGEELMRRAVNVGFSGGEKKRAEIFQMTMLEPSLAILDETDSGLDIDALKVVSEGINRFKSADRAVILVTHYQRLLNYVVPDVVHVMHDGRLVKSGGKELAQELEKTGYAWIEKGTKRGSAEQSDGGTSG